VALKWAGGILAGTVVTLVLVLALLDWNTLRGPVSQYLSGRLHREVRIGGPLNVKLFSWTPTAELNGLFIEQPDWVREGTPALKARFADVEKLTVSIDLKRLLSWRVVLPQVSVTSPRMSLFRDQTGRANWDIDETSTKPFHLPPIRHFVITDGQIDLADAKRKLLFTGTVSSEERDTAAGAQFFGLTGKGSLNRAPFSLQVKGDPLLNIDPDQAYDFDGHVSSGSSRIDAKGSLSKPFDLGAFNVDATFAGQDMASLYYLTGLALPNTPPYRLSGKLVRDGDTYRFTNFGGKVGDSDLHGELTVDASGDKPYLKADLASKKLDFDDLGPLIGAHPATGAGETASPEQKAQAAQSQAIARVLPDAPLHVERLRQMDADVHYRADQVVSRDFPLRIAETRLSLKNGVLKLTPVSFTFSRGMLNGDVQIDARKDVPVSDIDVRLTGLRLDQFMPSAGGPPALEGEALARAKLHGSGNSIHKAASTADGTLSLVVPRGAVRQAFAELLGINVASALGLLLTNDKSQTDVRCAVANFSAKNGTMRLDQFVFDTDVVTASGEGTVDFKNERVDLAITGHPKKPQLVRVRAPITITGPLMRPVIGVQAGSAIVQGGLAAGLAAVLSPLAAILPFVDPGLGKDADCGALLAQAKAHGAPVVQRQAAR
jgi:AsmA family protein